MGRYELVRRLEIGGMAEIYLARATGIEGFEKLVVLKRILPCHAERSDFVTMFLDEARIAATLHHPNIAQVYDIGTDTCGYFFTMEFVPGKDLRHLRKLLSDRRARMPLDQAIAIISGCAAGLHAAHEQRRPDGRAMNIVHRDVSPANILVTFDGCVKLIDFGIAKAAYRQTETHAGVLKGKTSFMSPEQCLGEPIDRRSDIFSLGILLYELSTNQPLFRGKTPYETMDKITKGEILPPSTRAADYPDELEVIVMRALERDLGRRYQTARALAMDLDAFARNHRLEVSPFALGRYVQELFPEDGPRAALERARTTTFGGDGSGPRLRAVSEWGPAEAAARLGSASTASLRAVSPVLGERLLGRKTLEWTRGDDPPGCVSETLPLPASPPDPGETAPEQGNAEEPACRQAGAAPSASDAAAAEIAAQEPAGLARESTALAAQPSAKSASAPAGSTVPSSAALVPVTRRCIELPVSAVLPAGHRLASEALTSVVEPTPPQPWRSRGRLLAAGAAAGFLGCGLAFLVMRSSAPARAPEAEIPPSTASAPVEPAPQLPAIAPPAPEAAAIPKAAETAAPSQDSSASATAAADDGDSNARQAPAPSREQEEEDLARAQEEEQRLRVERRRRREAAEADALEAALEPPSLAPLSGLNRAISGASGAPAAPEQGAPSPGAEPEIRPRGPDTAPATPAQIPDDARSPQEPPSTPPRD